MEREARRAGLVTAAGTLAVVVGVLVLRSPSAQAGFGWFSYGPPPPAVLDDLVAWNLVRAVGAVLVLLGLLVLAHLLGLLAGRRGGTAVRRLAVGLLLLAAVLAVGGLLTFDVPGRIDGDGATVSITKFVPGSHLVVGPAVWTHAQLGAALVVATGLVVGAVGTGLRARRPA